MSADVIDFPTEHLPSFAELERLNSWQTTLTQWRAELHREHTARGLSDSGRQLSRERFHVGVRKQWKVLTGGQYDGQRISYG